MTGLADLWPFQLHAVEKGRNSLFFLCCDDMGSGKTYIGCGMDLVRREQSPGLSRTLVLAPISTHQGSDSSWKETYERVTGLPAFVIDPKSRAWSWRQFEEYTEPCAFIMHYEAVRLMPELHRFTWLHVILDECHRIQNRKAIQTQQVKKLKTAYKLGLSGTPATTNPDKFWSVLNWLDRKEWSSYWKFRALYIVDEPVYGADGEIAGGGQARQIIGVQNVEQLHRRIEPYYIRRTKKQVLPDLPDKLPTSKRFVELGPEQRAAYKSMKQDMIAWVKRMQAETGSDEMTPIMAQNAAVKALRLVQFADAYAVWDEETGKVKLSEPSSKLDEVMMILKENPDQQFAIWSAFRQMIDLVEVRLKKAGIGYSIVTGAIPSAERGAQIQAFQEGRNRIFIGTIAAGGVGITLTATNMPIFIDRDRSPALNRQAEDRHHRAGQKREVQPIDIMARGTIDQTRLEQMEAKWSWILTLLGDNL